MHTINAVVLTDSTQLEADKACVVECLKKLDQTLSLEQGSTRVLMQVTTVGSPNDLWPKIVVKRTKNWNRTEGLLGRYALREELCANDSVIGFITAVRDCVTELLRNIVLKRKIGEQDLSNALINDDDVAAAHAVAAYFVSQMNLSISLWGDGIALNVKPTNEAARDFGIVIDKNLHKVNS